MQLNNIVLGLETDLQWLNGNAEFSVDSTNPLRPTVTTSAAREMNMLLIVRGRVGVTLWERSLFYASDCQASGDVSLSRCHSAERNRASSLGLSESDVAYLRARCPGNRNNGWRPSTTYSRQY